MFFDGSNGRECLATSGGMLKNAMATRSVPGLAEMFRSESRHHTELAWLSRADAVMIGQTLVIALPGSPKAVMQGMQIIGPLLSHARSMIAGGGHA